MGIEVLLRSLPEPEVREAWNTAFGSGSLFEAWTRTGVASRVYAANVATIRPLLDERPNWVAVEVGAGNGALWSQLLRDDDVGTLVAVDPVGEALDELEANLPAGVTLDRREGRVEEHLDLPAADVVVCALTLHHVAGRSAAERAAHGMSGPGKHEVLTAFQAAATKRAGWVLVNEADIHCEVDLPAGDPVLRERLIDSYVRRCGRALLDDLADKSVDPDLRARWRHILRHWCLDQVAMARVPVAERDVYELDVGRWRTVLTEAGLEVVTSRCTDDYGLFYQHVCRAE